MEVESEIDEEYSANSYEEIAEEIFKDSEISTNIKEVKIKFDSSKPLFFLGVKTKGIRQSVKVKEITDLREDEEGVKLVIRDEKYATNLLSMLWEKFGKTRIEQPSRLEILGKDINREEIEDLELNPTQELKKSVFSLMWQILPEGFRVRRSFSDGEEKISIIATENEMKDEWIQEGKELHEEF